MVGRGDGLTSIRIYLSNDLKINAHEKNDFNDSAIGGTPIAFLRTETQYAKAGHHVYAATTVQSADVCLLQGPRSYQDRRKAFSRGMGRDTLDQRLRGYRRRQRPAPHFQTRAKMTYDDNGMYFAVLMEEPHVWATITEHDA